MLADVLLVLCFVDSVLLTLLPVAAVLVLEVDDLMLEVVVDDLGGGLLPVAAAGRLLAAFLAVLCRWSLWAF